MDAKTFRETANQLGTDMKALLDKAKEENRSLSAEESEKFDKMDADRETALAEEARWLKVENLDKGTGRKTSPSRQADESRATSSGQHSIESDKVSALRGWMLGPRHQTAEMRAAADRLGVSIGSQDFTINFADTPAKSLRSKDMREWETRAVISGAGGSPNGGGQFTVFREMLGTLERALLAHGGMRQAATIIRTQSGSDLPIPTVNDTSNKGSLLAELNEHTELDVNFSQLVLEAYKYTSRRVMASVEYLQDNDINFVDLIGTLLGERIARILNDHLTTGDGSGKPRGIVSAAASSGVTTAAAGSVSYDNIIDLVHSVDPAYRDNARFMFGDAFLKILKKIKVPQFSGDTAGYPLWRPGFATGEPDTIDGYRYIINQSMPATTAGQKAALFGDLSKYVIRDVKEITLIRLDERYAELGQVAFIAWSRHDGDLKDAGTNPVKYLTMGN